jgi:GNAT superfamily N-acetyltransferase
MFTKWKNDPTKAEFLITVSTSHQNLNIGRKLFDHVKICAKKEGIKFLCCKIPKKNENFKIFVEKNNFKITTLTQGGYLAELSLD